MATATLKSALRFPSRPAPAPTTDLPQVPFDFNTPPPQHHRLVSRFSAETLVVKSPPLLSRVFSTRESPPTSPLRSTRLGHVASASESRINILSPTAFDFSSSDKEEVLSPRATSSAEGRWGVAAAREVFENLGGKRHARSGSGASGRSFSSGRSRSKSPTKASSQEKESRTRPRASKSFSSPSTTTTAGLNPPPRPPRRGAAPPAPRRAPPPAPRPSSPSDKLVDLPPRSDSRNACAPVKLVSSRPLRPLSPPSVVETAPLSIHHRPTPFAPPPVPAPTTPFRAVVVQRPSTHAVHTQNPGSLLVTINAGGSTYTTCLETLTSQGRAGKLGEFAEAVVEEVKRAPPPAATKRDTVARASSLYPSSDDGESILNSSHFAVSPFSSPFPYAPYDDLQPSALDLDLGATEFLPSSPTSPIDPYAKKLFLPLPPPSFVPPPSALSPVKNNSQLVRTPSPHLRIKSFHPEIVPSPPSSGKTECERRASSLSDSGTVSDDEYNDCDAIALRSRLHLSSTTTEVNPFERALGPFFEVLHGQSQAASSDDHAMAVERESIGYPVDIGEDTAEDRSRSTMLGVPRGSLRVKGPRRMRTAEEMGPVPEVPRVFVDSQERRRSDGSRPPSLSHSLSTIDAEGDFASARTLHEPEPEFIIFLDRTPAQDVYSAILTFLRDDVLPPPFSLPRAPSNDQKRSSTTPDVDPSHLSILSLSPLSLIDLFSRLHLLCTEAKWFGMDALVARCEMERERLTEVVAWLEEEKERKAVKEERERRAVVMKGREKAGWI